MNDLDYLNQISSPLPSDLPPTGIKSLTSGPLFKILIGILAFVIISVIGVILITALTPKEVTIESELTRINLRSTYLLDYISTYSPRVKSSNLRAAGSTLSTALTQLETNTSKTLSEIYGLSPTESDLSPEDSKLLEDTSLALEHARLNGLLDRYFASEMAYQISHLLILEDATISRSPDPEVTEYLESSRATLTQLEETFSSFSESD